MKKWFFEVNREFRSFPCELAVEIDSQNIAAIEAAANLAQFNLERVLKFDSRLVCDQNDIEQSWYDLLAELDVQSYFAATSVPFLRQSLERAGGYIFGEGNRCQKIINPEFLVKCSSRMDVIEGAHMLSCELKKLKTDKDKIACIEDFFRWCERALLATLGLICLAIMASNLHHGKDAN